MHSFLLLALSGFLLLSASLARADVYGDVNRLIGASQWSQAQSQIDAHLQSRPTDPQMRLLQSRVQTGQGQTAAAIATLQALSLSFPELPEPHNNLAALLASQNRYAEALEALQAAVRARPDYALALENLGDVYIALAIEAYQKASAADPAQARTGRKKLAAEQLLKSASSSLF